MYKMITSLLILLIAGFGVAEVQASPLADPGDDVAQIVGGSERRAQYLYRVNFIEVDGESIGRNRDVIWLEPGRYTLTVQMFIRNPPGMRTRLRQLRRDDEYNKIELVVEAGKRYHVLAKYDREREGAPFRTVLHKVEEMGD